MKKFLVIEQETSHFLQTTIGKRGDSDGLSAYLHPIIVYDDNLLTPSRQSFFNHYKILIEYVYVY